MPKRIKFEGKTHVFPDDFSDAEISSALESAHPAEAPKPAPQDPGIMDKVWESVKGFGRGLMSLPQFAAEISKLSPLSSEGNQLGKAKEMIVDPVLRQHEKARQDVAEGNPGKAALRGTVGSIPLVGPALLDQSERIADPATRYGAIGEVVGQAAIPEAIGMARQAPGVIARAPGQAVAAVESAVKSPGAVQLIEGIPEVIGGSAMVGHGNLLHGLPVAGRGLSQVIEGLRARSAAKKAATAEPVAQSPAPVVETPAPAPAEPAAAPKMAGAAVEQMRGQPVDAAKAQRVAQAAEALGDLGTADLKPSETIPAETFEADARGAKAEAVARKLFENGIDSATLTSKMTIPQWKELFKGLGENEPGASSGDPSVTIGKTLEKLRDMERAARPKAAKAVNIRRSKGTK